MAIIFETRRPDDLLSRIKSAVDEDRIDSWTYDKDGDFTLASDRWRHEAWLRPSLGDGRLTFYIVPPKTKVITKVVYAVYHSRFIEAILTVCDDAFTEATATAMPKGKDQVKGPSVPAAATPA
jgi:hypothetical protein